MPHKKETGRYTGSGSLAVGDNTYDVQCTLTSWVDVLDGGVEGLVSWGGVISGDGTPDMSLVTGGLHRLRLSAGEEGDILATSPDDDGEGWSAPVQGSGPVPF